MIDRTATGAFYPMDAAFNLPIDSNPSLQRKVLHWALVILLTTGNTGCSFKKHLRRNLYRPTAQKEKLPYKVVVVLDDQWKLAQSSWNEVGGDCTVMLQPGLTNALEAQLSDLFKEVAFTENPGESQGGDFLVLPRVDRRDPGRLTISLRDPATQKIIGTYENGVPTDSRCPFFTCAVPICLSVYSLCTLCPLTMPWAINGNCTAGARVIEKAVSANLAVIAKKIRKDERKLKYHGNPPLSLSISTSSVSSPLQPSTSTVTAPASRQ